MLSLGDLRELCDRYVPSSSRWPASIGDYCAPWWYTHEIGHLLVAARRDIGKRGFGVDDPSSYSEHYRRCVELAAMRISRSLLVAAGCWDLADDEVDNTDVQTVYWDDRGYVRRLLRRRGVARVPTTRVRLERMLAARSALS